MPCTAPVEEVSDAFSLEAVSARTERLLRCHFQPNHQGSEEREHESGRLSPNDEREGKDRLMVPP